MLSIGIDISKEKVDVAVYNGSKFLLSKVYKNTTTGANAMIKEFANITGEVRYVMEATGTYYLTYAYTLHEKGCKVYVINPLIIKRFGEMHLERVTTDKTSAKLIAMYGYIGNIRLFKPSSKTATKLKVLLKTIDSMTENISINNNYIESTIPYGEMCSDIISGYKRVNRRLSKEIEKFEKQVQEIVDTNYKDLNKRLRSIPGIGKRIAPALIGYFENFDNFENASEISSFVGITPILKDSGKSVRKRKGISKMGPSYLRKILYMGALSAGIHNKQCKEMKIRMTEKGKFGKVIKVAIAHKLLKQAFAIGKYNRMYDPNYCNKKKEILCLT